jgi:hypothetical protein
MRVILHIVNLLLSHKKFCYFVICTLSLLFALCTIFFYKSICNVVSSLFKRISETHTIVTRQSEFDFYVPRSNVTSCRWFIVTHGPFVWNNLPERVKSCVKLPMFKNIVKSMLFDDYN